MLVLNRPGPISRGIGGAIGFVKEYNADRKAKKEAQGDSSSDDGENDHEWAQAIDEAEQESRANKGGKPDEKQNLDDFVVEFMKRYPPPPYHEQQPSGKLALPVILPQRRPQSRVRGFVRGYAPVLEVAEVSQEAWLEFLDGFEKSISDNYLFWAANIAVFVSDKAYQASAGFNPLVMIAAHAIHLSVEAGRRGYIHNQHNKYLDYFNDGFFKPRGLYCMIIKYKPEDLNELSELVDVRKNITEDVIKRDDPERSTWRNVRDAAASTTSQDAEMPDFAPLVFPSMEKDSAQKENAFKHFMRFRQEYQDRQAQAKWDVQNPDSKLASVVPQQEWASRYSNPNHPSRQGGTLAVLTGGKYNPKDPIRKRRDRRREQADDGGETHDEPMPGANAGPEDKHLAPGDADMEKTPSNVSSGGTGKDEIAWQASRKRRQNPIKRLLRQDVLYLMVVNMPSEVEMEAVRRQHEAAISSA